MSRDVSRFLAPDFLSLTIGIVVYFVGVPSRAEDK